MVELGIVALLNGLVAVIGLVIVILSFVAIGSRRGRIWGAWALVLALLGLAAAFVVFALPISALPL